MNSLEKRMVDILKDLKENYYVVGIKAEFEAEGTRMEEALRLKEVVTKAGLDLTIKIGGCEAIKDMYDARAIGVTRIVAPMIESAYALYKYLKATEFVFPEDEIKEVDFLVNIETITGYKNFDEMLKVRNIKKLKGIVFGRVDMCGSLGLDREDINSDKIFEIANSVLSKAKNCGLECVMGGGISKEALPFMRNLPNGVLDRYETRKVIFKCPEGLGDKAEIGILKAVGFELMWLKNKKNFYSKISEEDDHRIEMLEKRYKELIEETGVRI
ncbi:MAG: aldolase/citrate lyase family protein [Elusimicrobiales bacterium]|nr:aldolase/citrate lyase family protein [Elusimicrobiales bacterium]